MRFLLALLLLCCVAAPALAQQREFQDCPECPVMVNIPPGRFTMGVPPGEEEAEGLPQESRGHSVPQTPIVIGQGFALGKHPVTRTEFQAFINATGHHPGNTPCWELSQQGDNWRLIERQAMNWTHPSMGQTGTDPVVCVSWDTAQAYVEWLSRRTQRRYRLPSEAEWEFAARAGSSGPQYWAGGRQAACGQANLRDYTLADRFNFVPDNTYFPCADGFAYTAPVGSFPANPLGLHDMIGNVLNWTQDCWNPNLQGQPRNGEARTTGDCALRVARGASWSHNSWDARAGSRDRGNSGDRDAAHGFRVARTH